jgi:hypothetical protein
MKKKLDWYNIENTLIGIALQVILWGIAVLIITLCLVNIKVLISL